VGCFEFGMICSLRREPVSTQHFAFQMGGLSFYF
jgi:hypothetical protein